MTEEAKIEQKQFVNQEALIGAMKECREAAIPVAKKLGTSGVFTTMGAMQEQGSAYTALLIGCMTEKAKANPEINYRTR